MIFEAIRCAEAFRDAGADLLIAHPEAGPSFHRSQQLIREMGMTATAGILLYPPYQEVIQGMRGG